jgi:hypothetical protein
MSETTFTQAFLAAQKEFPTVPKTSNGQVGPRNYKYADLASILEVVLPVLHKHDLILFQRCRVSDGATVLETVLRHTSGDSEKSEVPLPVPEDYQRWGSALTYARRYSITAILGITPDDDDDAQSAQGFAGAQRNYSPPAPSQNGDQGHGICPKHNIAWFMKGRMKSPAHPDGDAWCNKPEGVDTETGEIKAELYKPQESEARKEALATVKEALGAVSPGEFSKWLKKRLPAVAAIQPKDRTDEQWMAVKEAAIDEQLERPYDEQPTLNTGAETARAQH